SVRGRVAYLVNHAVVPARHSPEVAPRQHVEPPRDLRVGGPVAAVDENVYANLAASYRGSRQRQQQLLAVVRDARLYRIQRREESELHNSKLKTHNSRKSVSTT